MPGLGDLLHLDFGFTPSTNLQQLRHADLAVGEEADIPAAWFDIGEATLTRLPQHYRRTAEDLYHYDSPTAGYEAVLELAPNGFVRLYPELWEMERRRMRIFTIGYEGATQAGADRGARAPRASSR